MSLGGQRTGCPPAQGAAPGAWPAASAPTAAGQGLAVAVVLAAMVLAVLDAGVANMALPAIAQAWQVPPAQAVWVVTAYQTGLVAGLLPCAAWGASVGLRRVFTAGVALFSVASLLGAVSPTLSGLVAARLLQGLGASATMALGLALLRQVLPPHRLGAAIGWNALAVALASAAGPTLGAALLATGHWQALFAFQLPVGLLVLAAARALPATPGHGRPPNRLSVVLSALGLGALLLGAQAVVATPLPATGLLLAGGLCLLATARRERLQPAPLLPWDLLGQAPLRLALMASMACFAATALGLLALPFELQHRGGQGAWATGLLMAPWPLTVALAAPLAGRLADRLPTAWLCAAGALCLSLGLAAAAFWPWQGRVGALVPMAVLCGLGFGLFQVPNNRHLLLAVARERSAAAGALQASARLLGQASGGVAMGLWFSLAPDGLAPRGALALGAALGLLSAGLSLARGHGLPVQPR